MKHESIFASWKIYYGCIFLLYVYMICIFEHQKYSKQIWKSTNHINNIKFHGKNLLIWPLICGLSLQYPRILTWKKVLQTASICCKELKLNDPFFLVLCATELQLLLWMRNYFWFYYPPKCHAAIAFVKCHLLPFDFVLG